MHLQSTRRYFSSAASRFLVPPSPGNPNPSSSMGSKRTSSKNPTNARSSPPPSDPPSFANQRNPKNSTLSPPSKSRKKPKLSSPIPADSTFPSLNPSTEAESQSLNRSRKGNSPDASIKISPEDAAAAAPRSSSPRWSESDTLKLLKSVVSFHSKGGFSITPSNSTALLKDINDWAPSKLSDKNLNSKLRHLRYKFQKSPNPGPESSEFDRSFHELASKMWGPESLKPKGGAAEGVKEQGKKPKGEKKKVDLEKEDEEEERDSENDEGADEKAEKEVELENGEEQVKDELLVDGDNGLLDAKGAGHEYKYLRLALEEYWIESKMNMDTLYAALPKVNPVQAKRLDENFREVFVGMLKLKMEKNKVSNEIILASLGC